MYLFNDCTFVSADGDKLTASFDGNILKISRPGMEMVVELKGVMIDDWYENENIRIRLNEDILEISADAKSFPVNTIRYTRFD